MEIEFHNREKELRNIQNVINTRPDLITFIYGPINSGKSTLMDEVIRMLPNNYTTFCIDLREKFVSGYDDFLKVLFEVHKSEAGYKQFIVKAIESLPNSVKGIPIPKSLLAELLSKESEDVFSYIIEVFEMIKERGKTPIMVLDELQVIGDLKIDGLLIYRLFNFFVSLTKKRHLCHVFAISSDSLFIERVYSEAMLQGRAEFLLVDDFDYETATSFLKKYGFNDDEIELVWDYFGGKPIYLVRAVKAKYAGEDLRGLVEKYLKIRIRQIKDVVYELEDRGEILRLFGEYADKESFEYERLNEEIRFCVKNNILFADPVEGIIKPQSRLDLLAIRRIFGEFGE